MLKKFTLLLFSLLYFTSFSQIKGKITTAEGAPVSYAAVAVQGTYNNTSANDDGVYELNINKPGNYTIIFQSLGYKTKKIPVSVKALPHILNVTLEDETFEVREITISNSEDPAVAIMRQAIAHRKENGAKPERYEADFYSKGVFRAKNIPKRIMGVKLEVPEGSLDATGSGILSLSESISHIVFEQPNTLKEKIIASKVSGQDSGYSYNSAREAEYNFYEEFMDFDMSIKMISPLAKSAFLYYRFKLEGSFFDGNNQQVNKIKVIPRRDKEPVFEGYIYIVDDSWAIYAADLTVKGYRLREPILESLNIKQNFTYNETNGIWTKNLQTFDIKAGMMGMSVEGHYTHVYNNYTFPEKIDEKLYNLSFEKDSSKKDKEYWDNSRPVPLSTDEIGDYTKKDSIFAQKKTVNGDSLLRSKNRFKIYNILDGYTYTKPNFRFNYDGVLNVPGYNTVQGWNFDTKLSLNITDTVKKRSFSPLAYFNYGIAEDRLRVWGEVPLRIGRRIFNFAGGNRVEQFNPSEPIDPVINSLSTLLFKNNFMKLYDKRFASLSHSTYIFKKINLTGQLEYMRRRPLYNNTDYVLFKDSDLFTSNNPLEEYNYSSAPFVRHSLAKGRISVGYRFGNSYYYNNNKSRAAITEEDSQGIFFTYEKAFASTVKDYEYDFIAMRLAYNRTLGDKGDFGFNFKAGKFFNADKIAFTDFKHFNGNQTHVGLSGNYRNVFNLLPYYTNSTNDSFLELHAEHNFKGYIMNKIPLLDSLLWNIVVGYHNITTPDFKPYHEFTAGFDNVGFGKFRFLRVDYVRAYQGGFVTDGLIFGLKFDM